ncbi:type II CRISPR RNA-guided endonuclease Cas9 [Actinomyces vulturis]|uniref:type II CRISPR RNA-guided endonuclease Cas9 n=1 Tax=Actinomyces vulturis TaxID=1857645 RepID=UPI00082D3733|nr:type II CRISPR RNA-guided endonuclease Cas9 [Actinomyces vulturis]
MLKDPKNYVIGIDVGSNSVGLCSVEINKDQVPLGILSATSIIHDSGVSKEHRKSADTLLKIGGIARRTRRRFREERRRLKALDQWLINHAYPLPSSADYKNPAQPWFFREELLSEYIPDEHRRKEMIAVVLRHMARHRGWRNPYTKVESLFESQPDSEFLVDFRRRVSEYLNEEVGDDLSLTRVVMLLATRTSNSGEEVFDVGIRLRGNASKNSNVDVVPLGKTAQSDHAAELREIAQVQHIDEAEWKDWIRLVFRSQSPKGSSVSRVGHDSLPGQERLRRASRASLIFQEYRIASALGNLYVREGGIKRPLTLDEYASAFEFLNDGFVTQKLESVSWSDVAEVIGVPRNRLGGLADLDVDNESFARRPPTNVTHQAMMKSKIKALREWWKSASRELRGEMISYLVDNEMSDAIIEWYGTLNDSDQLALDELVLQVGRAAYSEDSLKRLTACMLSEGCSLTDALTTEFGVSPGWRPPAAPVKEPVGNPAVDRVLTIVNDYVREATKRWGAPQRINIEHVRSAFMSEASSRSLTREMDTRAQRRLQMANEIAQRMGIRSKLRGSDVRRFSALQRQNGQCAYCGDVITFNTAEMDHIIPRKDSTSDSTVSNLVAVCGRCNRSKTNIPFAVWAENCGIAGVSVDEAVARVKFWVKDPKMFPGKQFSRLQSDVIRRFKQRVDDPPFDTRSMESVAWMARELRFRLDYAYPDTKVRVFRGSITAEARKASGFENRITMIGGKGKQRLDRRHHAVDALVIAMMRPKVAEVLALRSQMKRAQQDATVRDDEGRQLVDTWKSFTGKEFADRQIFDQWVKNMGTLAEITQRALDNDQISVQRQLRIRLGGGRAHDDTIHELEKHQLFEEIPESLIDRAATPALWCALTRHPDYVAGKGLPENQSRTINLQGTRVHSHDEVEFFASGAPQIKVRGGSAEIGGTIHHARIYRYPAARGNKMKIGMVRVFACDLLKHHNEDLFSVPLAPQSISVRSCEPALRSALEHGIAEFMTELVVGDELLIPHVDEIGVLSEFSAIYPGTTHWVVDGFPEATRLRLRPAMMAGEGLASDASKSEKKILQEKGWIVTLSTLFSNKIRVVRRNALGYPVGLSPYRLGTIEVRP